jgi:hypothetical protein
MRSPAILCVFVATAAFGAFFGVLSPTVDAYYVDSIDGSDGNPGTYNSPFRTISHLVSVDSSTPKARWRFAVSSSATPTTQRIWRESLTVPRNNMTIDAYDPRNYGGKYLIDSSDPITGAAWSPTGGQANVYQVSVTLDAAVDSGGGYVLAFENGAQLSQAVSIADCQATQSSYYPSGTSGTIILYVHLASNSDPRAKADGWIEFSARAFGISTRAVTGVTISGAWTRRNLHTDGSMVLGANCHLWHSLITQGSKHSCYVKANATLDDVELLDGYWGSNGASPLVLNDVWGSTDSIQINHVTSHFTVMPASGVALLAHGTGNLGSLVISNSTFMAATGISAGQIARLVVQDAGVNAVSPGISVSSEQGGSSVVLTRVSISLASGASRGVDIQADAFEGSPQSIALRVSGGSIAVAGNGSNCIFNGSVASAFLRLSGVNLSGQSGVVQTVGGVSLFADALSLAGITGTYYYFGGAYSATSNNNDFGLGAGSFTYSGSGHTLTQWKATGQDANSTP